MQIRPTAGLLTLASVAATSLAIGVASAAGTTASLNLKVKPKHPTTGKFKIIASGRTTESNTTLQVFYQAPKSNNGVCLSNAAAEGSPSLTTTGSAGKATIPAAGPFSKTFKQHLTSAGGKSLLCGYLTAPDGSTETMTQIVLKPGKKHHKK